MAAHTLDDHLQNYRPFIKHSIALDVKVYENEDYFCKFTPRIHRDAYLADAGSLQCQIDFLGSSKVPKVATTVDQEKGYVANSAIGSINPTAGNFTALCLCEALPDRLPLTSYMIEYAYIHDDVIEYAESTDPFQLLKANMELTEGLDIDQGCTAGTKDRIRRRQLQAKMAVELLDTDTEKGTECLQLWKEMSDTFVQIRSLQFDTLDEYLSFRIIDAGCPWTMSVLCFSMDFKLNENETKSTLEATNTAYNSWVLVNDYFSWEKELKNHRDQSSKGEIANAVFLFAKWYSLSWSEAKSMLREKIIAYEEKYCREREALLTGAKLTARSMEWIDILDHVTAGNFVWSMTTARYDYKRPDSYPSLRASMSVVGNEEFADTLSKPISATQVVIVERLSETACSLDPNTPNYGDASKDDKIIRESRTPILVGSLDTYEEVSLEPSYYLQSMPSKGVRNSVIDGLEAWYRVPEQSLSTIRNIIDKLHCASLMLDDIQDQSELRRGFPSTHVIFGVAQTINSANLLILKASEAAQSLSATASKMFTKRVIETHIGQGMDLYWTQQTHSPTEEEYFIMVDGKTGGLFMLLADLMRSEATANKNVDLTQLMKALGRFFQARDDYQNLESAQYAQQKGFADDISEGKISLPIIHALDPEFDTRRSRNRLRSILQERKTGNRLSLEVRKLALDEIKASGALQRTRKVVVELQEKLDRIMIECEQETGSRNWILRLMQKRLNF